MEKNPSEELLDAFDLIMITISEFANKESLELNLDITSDLILILYKILTHSLKKEGHLFEIIQKVSQAQKNNKLRSKEAQCLSWIYEFLVSQTTSSVFSNLFSDENLLKNMYNSDALLAREEVCLKIVENLEEKCEENDVKFPPLTQTVNDTIRKLRFFNNQSGSFSQYKSKYDSITESNVSETDVNVDSENIGDLSTIGMKSDNNVNERKNKLNSVSFDTSTHISHSGKKFSSSNAIYDHTPSLNSQQPFDDNQDNLYTTFIDEYEKLIERFYSNLGIRKSGNEKPQTTTSYIEEEKMINKINQFKREIQDPSTSFAQRVHLIEEITSMRLKIFLTKNEPTSKTAQNYSNEHVLIVSEDYEHQSYFFIKEKCFVCCKEFARPFRKIMRCTKCHIYLHEKCQNNVVEPCVEIEKSLIIMNLEICPEIGLSRQKFRCGFCKIYLPKMGLTNCRKCEYSGLYYCSRCHLGYTHAIPARMIKNFDFELYPVSLASFSAIQILWNSRIFHLLAINPELIRIFPVLKSAKEIRAELSELKIHIEKCLKMNKNKVLKPLNNRPYLLDNDDTFTLNDLFELHSEKLLTDLRKTKILILNHISQCDMCYDICHMCLICRAPDALFKFAQNTETCAKCNTIYHRKCLKIQECLICLNRCIYIRSS